MDVTEKLFLCVVPLRKEARVVASGLGMVGLPPDRAKEKGLMANGWGNVPDCRWNSRTSSRVFRGLAKAFSGRITEGSWRPRANAPGRLLNRVETFNKFPESDRDEIDLPGGFLFVAGHDNAANGEERSTALLLPFNSGTLPQPPDKTPHSQTKDNCANNRETTDVDGVNGLRTGGVAVGEGYNRHTDKARFFVSIVENKREWGEMSDGVLGSRVCPCQKLERMNEIRDIQRTWILYTRLSVTAERIVATPT